MKMDPELLQRVRWRAGAAELSHGGEGRLTLRFRPDAGPGWTATFGAVAVLSTDATADRLRFRYRAPGADLAGRGPLVVTAEVRRLETAQPEASGLELSLTADLEYPLTELLDPVIRPASGPDRGWRFLVPDGEGLLLDGDGRGPGWRDRVTFHQLRNTLPVTALVHENSDVVIVLGVGGQDHAAQLFPNRSGVPGVGLVQLAARGRWRYRRSWKLVSSRGGSAACARLIREHLKTEGQVLATTSSKLAGTALDAHQQRAVGGSVLWCHFDTLDRRLITDLADAGLRSLLVMGRPVTDAARASRDEAGFTGGPYFQTYDVFPPGSVTELGWRGTYPPEGASDGWPDDLIRDPAGWLDPAWVYLPFAKGDRFFDVEQARAADGSSERRWRTVSAHLPVQSYRRCPARHLPVIERRAPPLLDSERATAVFYDINTAMWGLECDDPHHPCDRRADMAFRIEALEAMRATGRAVFSEAGKWWGIDSVIGFEGLLSYDQELNPDNVQLTDYPEDIGRRGYEFDLRHRVPLFGLVAREAVTRTLWWGTAQDRHTATWPSKDAFTALYGGNPLFVVDPDHPLQPGSRRWQRFLRTARLFDVLAELIRDQPIVDHRTEDGQLGWTQFGGGATVEANVGFTSLGGLGPGEVVVRDAAGTTVATISSGLAD